MSYPTEAVFPFPDDITRRERLEFSKHAGVTIQAFSQAMKDEGAAALTVEAEAAMILIAARRKLGDAVTFEDVLDHDGWTLPNPAEGEDPAPLA